MKFAQRATLIAVAAATSLALVAPTAQADTITVKDGVKSGYGQDIKWAKVTHDSKRVKVVANVGWIVAGDEYTLWLDTDSKDAGPEYKMFMTPNSDYNYIVAVESFTSKGKRIRCSWPSYKTLADEGSSKPEITFQVNRSCIKNPSKVRVSLKTKFFSLPFPDENDPGGKVSYDYLPAKGKFTKWVRR